MASDTAVFNTRGVALLVRTLTNPTDPHALCSTALRELCLPFHRAQQAREVQTKSPHLSSVLRAAMEFFTFPVSNEMLASLKSHLSICECDMDDAYIKTLHPANAGCGHRTYDRFILVLASIVGFALVVSCPGQLPKTRKGRTPETQPWPHTERDLLGGLLTCRDSLRPLLIWAQDIPSGAGIFIVLNGLLQFWEPFSRELGAAPQIFTLARDHLIFSLTQYTQTENSADFRFVYPLFCVANRFFPSLRCLPMKFALAILAPTYSDLCGLALRFQPILRDAQNVGRADECLVRLDRAEEWFELILALDTATFVDEYEGAAPEEGRHHWAFSAMIQIRNQNKCMRPGCPSPAGTRTSHCARCGIVRYCGVECQRSAWPEHKPLCKSIHTLRRALALEDATEWSNWVGYYTARNPGGEVADARRVEFVALCEARGMDTVCSEEIRLGIQRLIAMCA
ncbi:hypothetical protein B0H19DRAFT_1154577 [Mycena capillaripes]|nr:hypothetical protein B0H19DRAFT_1154577 [Mycena capillaripes]